MRTGRSVTVRAGTSGRMPASVVSNRTAAAAAVAEGRQAAGWSTGLPRSGRCSPANISGSGTRRPRPPPAGRTTANRPHSPSLRRPGLRRRRRSPPPVRLRHGDRRGCIPPPSRRDRAAPSPNPCVTCAFHDDVRVAARAGRGPQGTHEARAVDRGHQGLGDQRLAPRDPDLTAGEQAPAGTADPFQSPTAQLSPGGGDRRPGQGHTDHGVVGRGQVQGPSPSGRWHGVGRSVRRWRAAFAPVSPGKTRRVTPSPCIRSPGCR